eukprot:7440549-Ditylum_brightwellii.AAC.1
MMLKSLQERKRMDEDSRKDLTASYTPNSREEVPLASQIDQDPAEAWKYPAWKVMDEIEDKEEDNDDLVKPLKQLSAHDK